MKFLIISLFSILYSAEVTSIYKIDGMMCSESCPKAVYDSIINVKGINSCIVNFDNETATIVYDDDFIESDKITDIIPTAGVCVYRKHVALLVNPTFFMEVLPNLEERAAVLKHEALHVMLKHIFQIRKPKFTNKFLYNIAADIEVNQYIGHPWKLPDSAVTLQTFPDLDLPPNDVAESYYNILLKELEKMENLGQFWESLRTMKEHLGKTKNN